MFSFAVVIFQIESFLSNIVFNRPDKKKLSNTWSAYSFFKRLRKLSKIFSDHGYSGAKINMMKLIKYYIKRAV